jgi:hypothetical protein
MFDPSAPPPVRRTGSPATMLLLGAGTVDVGCGVKVPPEPTGIGFTALETLDPIDDKIRGSIVDICLSYQNVSVSFICRVVGIVGYNCATLGLRLNINI